MRSRGTRGRDASSSQFLSLLCARPARADSIVRTSNSKTLPLRGCNPSLWPGFPNDAALSSASRIFLRSSLSRLPGPDIPNRASVAFEGGGRVQYICYLDALISSVQSSGWCAWTGKGAPARRRRGRRAVDEVSRPTDTVRLARSDRSGQRRVLIGPLREEGETPGVIACSLNRLGMDDRSGFLGSRSNVYVDASWSHLVSFATVLSLPHRVRPRIERIGRGVC